MEKKKYGPALTWNELADLYPGQARTKPMSEVFQWAEDQPDKFYFDPKEKSLHLIKKSKLKRTVNTLSPSNNMDFKVGDIFYLQKGLPDDPLYKCHVLAIVDDDKVVYKWYGRRKQYWRYEVDSVQYLQMVITRLQMSRR